MTAKSLSILLFLASSAGLPVQGAGPEEVPFKGSLEAVFSVMPLDPTHLFVEITQCTQCEVTHLGKFTLTMPHTVELTSPTTATATGFVVLTAANGDTITARFVGNATLEGPIANILEVFVITGGTGRFSVATGSFRFERTANLATLKSTGTIEGTISAPGAKN